MRHKLAGASAITLALMLAAPATAQEAGTTEPLPEAGTTEPGAMQDGIDLDAESPDVATDPLLEEDDPALATDPMPGSDSPGVAQDAEIEDAPGVATDPSTQTLDQDVADDTTTDPTAPAMGGQRIAFDELDTLLGEIGVEDRELFFGQVIRGETEDGERFALLIGPEDFDAGEGDADSFVEFADFQGTLSEADFQNVQQDIDWLIMQGKLEGHAVFAMGVDTAGAPHLDEDEVGYLDADGLREHLGEAGIDFGDEVETKLFRAATETGATVFLLVGPEGFVAGESVEKSADELIERFEDAGLSDVEEVEDDIHLVRGEYDGSAVLAVSGEAMQERDTD
jgi:hypothetical protein